MIEVADRFKTVKEYYFSAKLQEIARMREEGMSVLNLGIGSPDLPPSKTTINTLVEASRHPNNHAYQAYRSSNELRNAMASFYKKVYNVSLNAKTEVLPLLGSKEGIMYISLAFLNPGDEVLVPNPGYPAYSAISNIVGAKVILYDLQEKKGWMPNFEVLEERDLSKVKLMWVNYPNMPTGVNSSKKLFKKLIDFAKRNRILVINDNPYSLVLNDEPQSILEIEESKEHVLELNSMSKSFNMSGWRVGMVLGKEKYIDAVLQAKSNVDSGMFLPVQKAASEALMLPQKWHNERNSIYAKRREIAAELINQLNCSLTPNQVGMFLWAKVPSSFKIARDLVDKLLKEAHIFITPGEIFGSNGNRFIRVSLASPEEDFKLAISRIIKWKEQKVLA